MCNIRRRDLDTYCPKLGVPAKSPNPLNLIPHFSPLSMTRYAKPPPLGCSTSTTSNPPSSPQLLRNHINATPTSSVSTSRPALNTDHEYPIAQLVPCEVIAYGTGYHSFRWGTSGMRATRLRNRNRRGGRGCWAGVMWERLGRDGSVRNGGEELEFTLRGGYVWASYT